MRFFGQGGMEVTLTFFVAALQHRMRELTTDKFIDSIKLLSFIGVSDRVSMKLDKMRKGTLV